MEELAVDFFGHGQRLPSTCCCLVMGKTHHMVATIDSTTSVLAAAICHLLGTSHHMVATIDPTTHFLAVASTDLSMAAAKISVHHFFVAAANMCMTAVHTILHNVVAAASPTSHLHLTVVQMGLCPSLQAAACFAPWLGSSGFVRFVNKITCNHACDEK